MPFFAKKRYLFFVIIPCFCALLAGFFRYLTNIFQVIRRKNRPLGIRTARFGVSGKDSVHLLLEEFFGQFGDSPASACALFFDSLVRFVD